MEKLVLIFLGGGAGAVARYGVGAASLRVFGSGWPYGTLIINVTGGFLMGALVAVLALKGGADQERWRLLLGVGLLGGFTTFSAFSLEVVRLIETRAWGQAFGYAALSVILSVAALFAGLMLMRKVLG